MNLCEYEFWGQFAQQGAAAQRQVVRNEAVVLFVALVAEQLLLYFGLWEKE